MKDVKMLLKGMVLLVLLGLAFTSCEQEDDDYDEMGQTTNTENLTAFGIITGNGAGHSPDSSDMDGDYMEDECIQLVYPVRLLFPDGTSQEANNDDELEQSFEDWLDQNPDSFDEPTFVFPIEIILMGETQTVNSEGDLCILLQACDDEYEDDDGAYEECFELVYPVTILFPDGTSLVANNYDELERIEDDWEDSNPDSEEEPMLEFPLDIDLEGEIVTIEDYETLEALEDECEDDDDDHN